VKAPRARADEPRRQIARLPCLGREVEEIAREHHARPTVRVEKALEIVLHALRRVRRQMEIAEDERPHSRGS